MIIKEIQGLRAISVLLILFYHLNIPYFKFGYLGVDIFFFISGFLFSKIILEKIDNNAFLIRDYIRSRANRLLPGLLLLLVTITVFSWFVLTPRELQYYGQSLVSTTFFLSNFYYYLINFDYFSPDKFPLVHLWSLSLEVQFYFFFPLILLFIYRYKKFKSNINIIIFLLFILSFFFNSFYSYDEKLIFYFLPARLWEFLFGYFIYNFYKKQNFILFKNDFLFFCIISFILYIIFGNSQFIKNQVLTLLTTCLIFMYSYNKKNLINSFLINSYNQIIGKYSYFIFLIHYPVIFFIEDLFFDLILIKNFYYLIVILIIFSLILFIYIFENKFHILIFHSKVLKFKYPAFLLIFFSLSVVGYAAHYHKGLKFRYFFNSQINADYLLNANHFFPSKQIGENKCSEFCIKSNHNNRSLLLFGDSHAADFEHELSELLNKKKINIYLSYYSLGSKNKESLDYLNDALRFKKVDYVFLVFHHHHDWAPFLKKIENIFKNFPNTKFYFFLYRAEFDKPPIKYKIFNKTVQKHNILTYPRIDNLIKNLIYDNFYIIDQNYFLTKVGNVPCNNITCFDGHSKNGYPIYRDNQHLTQFGAKILLNEIFKTISLN
jgi:peptidoglycan/LPS O-acetylase OafA/YrhL